MKNKKSYLDEMQDRRLLRIEEIGVWLAFWGLVIAIALQFLLGGTIKDIGGEIAVLTVLGVYILCSCIKNGIWARDYKATVNANAVAGIVSALVFGALLIIKILRRPADGIRPPMLIAIALSMLGIGVASFVVLEVMRYLYQKRREKLEDAGEEE